MNNTSKVVHLPPSGLANDNRQLAALLRDLAYEVENDEWGDVDNVVVVIDGDEVDHVTFGRPCDRARVVGLLTYAVHRIIKTKN